MTRIDKKGMEQICIVACELMKQRLVNKNHATIQKSPNFCNDEVSINFKVKKKGAGLLIHFDIKNQKGHVFQGRYKIIDPTLTTSEIIHSIWEDIIPSIYKQYGVNN